MRELYFKLGVGAVALAMVTTIAFARFCGTVKLPPKPPPPTVAGTAGELLVSSTSSPAVYQTFVENDAKLAGIAAPSLEQMAQPLRYLREEAGRALTLDSGPVEMAGLRLSLERRDDVVVLVAENLAEVDVAYNLVAHPSAGSYVCSQAAKRQFNALWIAKDDRQAFTVCIYRRGLEVAISRAETIQLPGLFSWYVQQLQPGMVGLERWARVHRTTRPPQLNCAPMVPQVVRSGLATGDLSWRDLIDFYARHRCETYSFPMQYRAIEKPGERSLPVLPQSSR